MAHESEAQAALAAAQAAEARAAAAQARAAELRRQAEAVEATIRDAASASGADTAAGVVEEFDTAAQLPQRRPSRGLWARLSAAAVAVVVCALLALSGAMVWQHHAADQDRQRAAEYSATAKQGVVNLMSLNFVDADAAIQRVIDSSTGKFKEEFSAQSAMLIEALAQSKVVTQVTVNSTAVESMNDDSAVVLVAAKSQATNVKDGRKEPQLFRVAVTVAHDNGELKVSQVDFV